MLPNSRLSAFGNTNSNIDSIGDFSHLSNPIDATSSRNSLFGSQPNRQNFIAANRATNNDLNNPNNNMTIGSNSGWGTAPKLADYLRESSWTSGGNVGLGGIQSSINSNNTSMPWAAAVKSPPDQHNNQHPIQHHQHQHHNHHHNALNHHHQQHHHQQLNQNQNHVSANQGQYDYTSTIGSWTSPETNSSTRGAWDTGNSQRNDGIPDDGTSIWGNPNTKKTGIDWTEKEMLNTAKVQQNNVSEKRVQKSEPIISSINGTEAWGAPQHQSSASSSSIGRVGSNNGLQQTMLKNGNSGNSNMEPKIAGDSLNNWGEPSFSLVQQQRSTSVAIHQQQQQNENSSLAKNNSIWNNSANKQQQSKSASDWPASPGTTFVNNISLNRNGCGISAQQMDDLAKQFDSATSLFKSPSTTDNDPLTIANGGNLGGAGGILNSNTSNNTNVNMNDLKHLSANFSSDLFEASANRQLGLGMSSSSSSSSSAQQATQSHHLDSSASAAAGGPSGAAGTSMDLLNQMIYKIQLAVKAGHLNPQILNQPMSTQSLHLVYQLLQQVKTMQGSSSHQQQQSAAAISNCLSGQSNPWAAAANNQSSSGTSSSADAMTSADSMFLKSTSGAIGSSRGNQISPKNSTGNSLYDWGGLDFGNDKASSASNDLNGCASSGNSSARPGPPPGILNSFGSLIGSSTGPPAEASSNASDNLDEPSRDSAASLWGGAWLN